MSDAVVLNTGPLIALLDAHATDVIGQLPVRFITSEEVQSEYLNGRKSGALGDEWPAWLEVIPLSQPLAALALQNLDAGEASVIQLALEQSIPVVAIDELKGRRCARALGLRVTGSLGLLARAKTLGLIPAVRPFVEAMASHGTWFHANLVAQFLAELGESDTTSTSTPDQKP